MKESQEKTPAVCSVKASYTTCLKYHTEKRSGAGGWIFKFLFHPLFHLSPSKKDMGKEEGRNIQPLPLVLCCPARAAKPWALFRALKGRGNDDHLGPTAVNQRTVIYM